MKNNYPIRIILYIFGLLLLALGTITSIRSDLGVAATTSAGYALSVITGVSLGTFTLVFFAVFMTVQLILLPNSRKKNVLLQIPASFLFSWLIDLLDSLIRVQPSSILSRVLFLLLSFLVTGIGAFLTIKTDIAPTPPDGLVGVISEKGHWSLGTVKNIFDIANVILAAILLFIFIHGIPGIGIGTLLCSLAVGRILDLCEKLFNPLMEKLCG